MQPFFFIWARLLTADIRNGFFFLRLPVDLLTTSLWSSFRLFFSSVRYLDRSYFLFCAWLTLRLLLLLAFLLLVVCFSKSYFFFFLDLCSFVFTARESSGAHFHCSRRRYLLTGFQIRLLGFIHQLFGRHYFYYFLFIGTVNTENARGKKKKEPVLWKTQTGKVTFSFSLFIHLSFFFFF